MLNKGWYDFSSFVNIFKGLLSSVSHNRYTRQGTTDWNLSPTPRHSHVKGLIHNVTLFGDRAFKEVIEEVLRVRP